MGRIMRDLAQAAWSGQGLSHLARDARDQVDKIVLFSTAGPDLPDAHGLTLYCPLERMCGHEMLRPDGYAFYIGKIVPFAQDAHWRTVTTGILDWANSGIDERLFQARNQITQTYGDGSLVDMYLYMDNLANL